MCIFRAESIKKVIEDVSKHKLCLRKAADKHQTLAKMLGKYKIVKLIMKSYPTALVTIPRERFPTNKKLKDFIKCSEVCCGRSTKDVRWLASELAVHNKI